MQTSRRSKDDDKGHPKRPGKGVEDAAIRNKDMRLKISPHLDLVMKPKRHG